jgi:hypothetical protein
VRYLTEASKRKVLAQKSRANGVETGQSILSDSSQTVSRPTGCPRPFFMNGSFLEAILIAAAG